MTRQTAGNQLIDAPTQKNVLDRLSNNTKRNRDIISARSLFPAVRSFVSQGAGDEQFTFEGEGIQHGRKVALPPPFDVATVRRHGWFQGLVVLYSSCLRKRGRGEVILMQMIARKCAMLIWARRGVGGVSMCLEGSGFPVAREI